MAPASLWLAAGRASKTLRHLRVEACERGRFVG
jgi:hypothetical protein